MGGCVSALRRVVRARSPTRSYGVLPNGELTPRCRRFQWWQRVQVVAESKKASSGLTRELWTVPRLTLDKPSAAFGLPTGAWTSRRCPSERPFPVEGAGLPTPPTGTTTTRFNFYFSEEEEGASRQS